jgi:hypothetical protein
MSVEVFVFQGCLFCIGISAVLVLERPYIVIALRKGHLATVLPVLLSSYLIYLVANFYLSVENKACSVENR